MADVYELAPPPPEEVNTHTVPALTPQEEEALRVPTLRFQTYCVHSYAGVMEKVTFTVPFKIFATLFTFDKLLNRYAFDLVGSPAGQRDISDAHVRQMLADFQSSSRPFVGSITVAIDRKDIELKTIFQQYPFVNSAVLTIPSNAPDPVIEDGQHRVEMCKLLHLWASNIKEDSPERARMRELLERTAVDVTMLLEGDPVQLSSIFVRMGRTRPLRDDLVVVMDPTTTGNRLARYAILNSELLRNRVSWLAVPVMRELRGDNFELLYGASAVRSAMAAMAGVGLRDRTQADRERLLTTILEARAQLEGRSAELAMDALGKDLVGLLDYAYAVMPGWRDVKAKRLSVAAFKDRYIHGSAAGLHVIANAIAAARLAGVDPRLTIDEMAKLPWERGAVRDARDEFGQVIKVHQMFENTLVLTRFNSEKGAWVGSGGGATRSNYTLALDKVLRKIARTPGLEPLGHKATAVAVGLEAPKRGPGRPRKNA